METKKLQKVDEFFYRLLGVSFLIMFVILNWTADYRVTFLFVAFQTIIWGIHGVLLDRLKERCRLCIVTSPSLIGVKGGIS